MSLLLALLLASDGGSDVPTAFSVSSAVLQIEDGSSLAVDGGVWISDDAAIRSAKELRRLRAENMELRAKPSVTPVAVVAALVVGAIAGGFLGFTTACLVSRGNASCR